MKRNFLFAAAVLLFSLESAFLPLFACTPKWLDTPEKNYPSSEYFSAVGSGSDRQSAESAAKFALCQILGEKLSGVQSVFQSADSNGSEFAQLDLSVQEQVIFEKITGISIKENYSRNEKIKKQKVKVHYALAVLKKSDGIFYYSSIVSDNSREISSLMTKAEMAKNSSSLAEKINSVSYMRKALALAEENEYNVEILSAIQGMRQAVSYVSVQNVKNRLKAISESIKVSVSVSGDDSGKILSQLMKAVKDFGFSVVKGTPDYVLNAALSFEKVDGSTLAKNVNDGSEYQYVRYKFLSEFAANDDGTILFPFESSGREGHVSEIQAKNRSIQKICTKIDEEFSMAVENFLDK